MKVPASIPEKLQPAKSQSLPTPSPEPGSRRSEERQFQPRYVALPRQWQRGHGRRNLVGGVLLLCFAVLFLGWALYLAGPGALLTVGVSFATATLLYVMARSRLFAQRNGAFVGWAGVALLSVSLVILQHGWLFMAGKTTPSAPEKVAATAAAPTVSAAGGETPLLRDAFPSKGDVSSGPAVRIAHDITVAVAGKNYLAKQGDLFPMVDVGPGEFRFSAGQHEIAIPSNAGEIAAGDPGNLLTEAKAPPAVEAADATGFVPPKELSFAQQVEASQMEAVRRYPGLARRNSPQNQAFLSAKKEMEFSGQREFFESSNWPLVLTEIVAAKDEWRRADEIPPQPTQPNIPVVPRAPASTGRTTGGR